MQKVKDYIKDKRPNLSESSLTTYGSILRNLYHRVFGAGEVDLKEFENTKPVLDYLKDMPPNKRKTILSSLVIITDKKQYRDLMLEDVKAYKKDIDKQEKTPAQEASWVDTDQIKETLEDLRRNANLLYKKNNKTMADLQQIQNFIIMAVLGSVYIAPRRSKDFVDFKIKDINQDKDNYINKNTFVFNSYKTAKTYGKQVVDIPVQLRNIVLKWTKLNPTKWLLFDSNYNPLSSVKLNQRLNKIFEGKKVGVNQLRHTYLTDKYADTIETKKAVKDDMEDMGSSSSMLDTYVKEN